MGGILVSREALLILGAVCVIGLYLVHMWCTDDDDDDGGVA